MAQTISFRIGNDGPELSPATVVTVVGLDNLDDVMVNLGERHITEWDADTATWTIGDLLNGQTAEMTITATNNSGVDQTVEVSITGRLRDPDSLNNITSWTFPPE